MEGRFDIPRNSTERTYFRDVAARAQKNLRDTGLDLSIPDIQSALWSSEKGLYKKSGAANSRSGESADFLDAAFSLVAHHKK